VPTIGEKAVPWKGICFQVEYNCSLGLLSRTLIRESSNFRDIRRDPVHGYLPTSAIMSPLLYVRAALERTAFTVFLGLHLMPDAGAKTR
jgi:hypothetical protein